MASYNFKQIEKKWQEKWEKDGLFEVKEDKKFPKKMRKYILDMFPYPSAQGLHVGHPEGYTASDILARYFKMRGYNVLHPMGWDAFGLPAENYAIKTGRHPAITTEENIARMKKQIKGLGFAYDWSREVNTADAEYYKWTQWIFLQLYKKGLAYEAVVPINWCPKDKTGLANEEVADGKCERCGTAVEKKDMKQWMLRITKYADRLIGDLEGLDWPEKIKEMQRNWIGKSEGAEIEFRIQKIENRIKVFTTRLDTVFGVSAIVLAPEHPIVASLLKIKNQKPKIKNIKDIEKYIASAKTKSDLERGELDKEKTGVMIDGCFAVNPFNGEYVPVWIADYVLANYGTGAVMMVPAHDTRDFSFAKKYGLEIKDVVVPKRIDVKNPPVSGKKNVLRRTIHGIVRNPKTGQFLCLKWKKFPWTTFVVGGVNDGEDIVEAAKREIREETGYLNLEFKKILGGPVRSEYFATHKSENRVAITSAVLFELKNEKKEAVQENEAASHECVWMDLKDINYNTMTCSELDIWLKRLDEEPGAHTDEGWLINSGEFSGLTSRDARVKMADFLESKKFGRRQINYHLRDWVFSRQRYWGEPIPLVHCEKCGIVPVPEEELPLKLPDVKKYEPTGTGESPLASIKEWVNTKCPNCRGAAKRETNTMPQWAGSCWYYLAYCQKGQETRDKRQGFGWNKEKIDYWMPVDIYIGGAEHAVLHLLYARFWHKFLYDIKAVKNNEPFQMLRNQGLILGEDGVKMSKSRGNVVNPDDIVSEYGADVMRIYEMFMGPFDEAKPWSTESIIGIKRFLDKVWNLSSSVIPAPPSVIPAPPSVIPAKAGIQSSIEKLLHKTIKGVTEDMENFKFNTAISKLMIFINEAGSDPSLWKREVGRDFLKLLSPFAPHLSEELWSKLGNKQSIFLSDWPKYDPELAKDEEFELVIQVNGRVRDKIMAPSGISEDKAKRLALQSVKIKTWLNGKEIRKIIFTGKLVNIVV